MSAPELTRCPHCKGSGYLVPEAGKKPIRKEEAGALIIAAMFFSFVGTLAFGFSWASAILMLGLAYVGASILIQWHHRIV